LCATEGRLETVAVIAFLKRRDADRPVSMYVGLFENAIVLCSSDFDQTS
jgi:hypothetical protein